MREEHHTKLRQKEANFPTFRLDPALKKQRANLRYSVALYNNDEDIQLALRATERALRMLR